MSDRRGLPMPLRILLLSALFAGALLLFVRLLQPLAGVDRPATAEAAPAPPIAAPPRPAPEVQAAPADVLVTAAPYRPDFDGPRIAVLLTDMGDNPAWARTAIAALPAEIGLAFTPYPDVAALASAARADGHEVWAGVPMQPKAWPRVNPGRNTLLVSAAPADNVRSLDWALARVPGSVGVTGIMGSAFTERAEALRPVLEEVARRRLAYVDARASARSVAVETARDLGVRAAGNDRFLDESGTVAANLAALEARAKARGSAIGFARPLPATVSALEAWAATLEAKGILLVPPGALAN